MLVEAASRVMPAIMKNRRQEETPSAASFCVPVLAGRAATSACRATKAAYDRDDLDR